jgi:hypothetical protein
MTAYINPEDIVSELNTPFNRAMGLAVAIANQKNTELLSDRFEDPFAEPPQRLFYIGGKSGVAGNEKPEAFVNIEKDSNADMGDAIITYSGGAFKPAAIVAHRTWITRQLNGIIESAEIIRGLSSEDWEWVHQGDNNIEPFAGVYPGDSYFDNYSAAEFTSDAPVQVIDDYYAKVVGKERVYLNGLPVADMGGDCVGPVFSSIFNASGKENRLYIDVDIMEYHLSGHSDTNAHYTDPNPNDFDGDTSHDYCVSSMFGMSVFPADEVTRYLPIFMGVGLNTFEQKTALFIISKTYDQHLNYESNLDESDIEGFFGMISAITSEQMMDVGVIYAAGCVTMASSTYMTTIPQEYVDGVCGNGYLVKIILDWDSDILTSYPVGVINNFDELNNLYWVGQAFFSMNAYYRNVRDISCVFSFSCTIKQLAPLFIVTSDCIESKDEPSRGIMSYVIRR